MADRDAVQLQLQITGQAEIDRLAKSTAEYRELLALLRAEYEKGDIAQEEYRKEHLSLIGALGRETKALNALQRGMNGVTQSAQQATPALEKQADALNKVEDAATAAAGKKSGNGRGMLGVSYAVQDFISVMTNGGGIGRALGSVSNNVDQLAIAAGATAAQAGLMSIGFVGVAAAAQILTPAVSALWKAISGGDEAAARTEERVKDLTKANEDLKKKLDELTPSADARIRQITAENDQLERQVKAKEAIKKADEEREARLKKLDEKQTKGQAAAGNEVAAAITPEGTAVRRQVAGSLTRQSAQGGPLGGLTNHLNTLLKAQRRHQEEDPYDLASSGKQIQQEIDEVQEQITAERARLAKQGDTVVDRAIQGAPGSLDALIGHLPEGDLRRRLQDLTPSARNARRMKNIAGIGRDFLNHVDRKTGDEARKRMDKDEEKRRKAAQDRKDRRHRQQAAQTDAILGGHADQIKEEEAEKKRAAAQAKRDAAAAQREQRHDEREHGTPEERQLAGQIQQQFYQETGGGQLSDSNALAAARQQIAENNRAQQQAAQAMAGVLNGLGQSTQMWQGIAREAQRQRMLQTRMLGGLRQGPGASGLGN